MKPKAVLFDMGGVLLKAAEKWDAEQFAISFPEGLPEPALTEWFLEMSGDIMNTFLSLKPPRPALDPIPFIKVWLWKRQVVPTQETTDLWFDTLCRWEPGPMYSWVPGAIREVCQIGYRIGLVSNTVMPGKYVREKLQEAGILDLFETTIFSAEVGINKPEPGIFHYALDAMRLSPDEAWYVGDKPQRDICGAHRAGMRAVLVDSKHVNRINDAPENTPDFRIEHVGYLPDLLKKI